MTTKHVFAFDYFGPEIRLSRGRSAIKIYLVSIQLTVWLN